VRFDRFLALLFSKKGIALILVIVIGAFCLSACQITFEDVLCLAFFGCVTPETCREMIWACDCGVCGGGGGDSSESACNTSCVGDAYNGCFGCVWEGGLKDCRPSKVCDSCSSDEEEYEPQSCDECMIGCLDGCIGMLEDLNE